MKRILAEVLPQWEPGGENGRDMGFGVVDTGFGIRDSRSIILVIRLTFSSQGSVGRFAKRPYNGLSRKNKSAQ